MPLFIGWMRQQFESEGAFWGTPWAPLSPGYAAFKSRNYPGKTILIAEGDLRRGASLPQREVTPRTLTLTIDWPKGGLEQDSGLRWDPAWHHLGRGNLPARPLLADGLPPTAMMELENAVGDYVDEMARRVGLEPKADT